MDHRNQVLPLLSEFFCRCKLDPQHITWLSLQVQPDPVFEGDILTLRCWGRRNAALSQVKFYRDGKFLRLSKDNQPLSTGTATVNSSGRYSCTGQVTYMQYGLRTVGVGSELVCGMRGQVLGDSDSTSHRHRAGPGMCRSSDFTSDSRGLAVQDSPPELRAASSQSCSCLLSVVGARSPLPREGSQRSAWQLLFSLHKEGHTLQDRSLHPELCIPAAEEGDSGLYWCKAALEGGWVQKQESPAGGQGEGRTGRPSPGAWAVGPPGNTHQPSCGAPPLRSSFYLNGDTLRNHMAPHGGAVSFLFLVMSEQDAGDYTCEAENSPRVLSAPTSNNWLVPWLPASLLGMMVIAAALLGICPQPQVERNTYCMSMNENDEGVVYSVVRTIPKESERPAQSARRETDISVIYTEVRRPQLSEVPAKGLKRRSRTQQDPVGDCEGVLC
ncbi:hypothetical protein EI555_001968 [Monodon monoceros]|uniref:Ig-like domain-containing protein n=1 Tax=Monodon monoceros TaxID=40151 RepID=A0A4U1FHL4_MONMO|nr:hypothetical protein EI555_001968 [Monodon monoceros]